MFLKAGELDNEELIFNWENLKYMIQLKRRILEKPGIRDYNWNSETRCISEKLCDEIEK